jgi:hypothetical protein
MYNGWSFLSDVWRNVSPFAEGSLLLLLSMSLWTLMESFERTRYILPRYGNRAAS